MNFSQALHHVMNGQSLSREEARVAFSEIMQGDVSPVHLAAFLTALRVKGESVDELTGGAEALRQAAVPVAVNAGLVLDCCGTGGDAQGSFNISSAVACVVAGAGYNVAKHGNRSVSSKSGSADVFEASGVKLEQDARSIERILKDVGLAFLYAPAFNPAMKHAAAVRRELATRTIFNLIGPLSNPARPQVQLIGVFDRKWLRPMAEALHDLGCRGGLVVHGHGHDELVLSGPNHVAILEDGKVREVVWTAEDFGYQTQPNASIAGGDAVRNAELLKELLGGKKGAIHDVVCMNAAALIQAASRVERPGRAYTLKESAHAAEGSIARGAARLKLESLIRHSRQGSIA